MAYLIVVALSLLVGGGVYIATLRASEDRPAAVGFEGLGGQEDGGDPEGPGAGYAYLRVLVRGPTWRDRIQGFVGLLVLIVVATVALAFGIYQLGHIVNSTIEHFFPTGPIGGV